MKNISNWLAIICITFLPLMAKAGWPIFSVPTPAEVSAKIQTEGCLLGEGRIPTGTEFPIKIFNTEWFWEYTGSDACQSIPDDPVQMNYVSFQKTGSYSGDSMTANYGKDVNHVLFNFTLNIPYCSWDKQCTWYCTATPPSELPTHITCAYDS